MAILLLADKDAAIGRVAGVLAALENKNIADASQKARKAWGVLAGALTSEAAGMSRRAFSEAGIGTRVIESGQWAALPSVQTLKRLPDAFEKVSIIAACGFTEMRTTETTTAAEGPTVAQRLASTGIMMMTGLPIRIGPKKQKNETKIERRTDDQLFFEIVGGSPLARYRIDARNFDYTCLGAKKTYSAAVNGKVLLKELAATYPDAWLNAGATQLCRGQAGESPYQSLDDLDRELLWLLTLRTSAASGAA